MMVDTLLPPPNTNLRGPCHPTGHDGSDGRRMESLSRSLTGQPWESIGTSDPSVQSDLVDRLVSILELRLAAVVYGRESPFEPIALDHDEILDADVRRELVRYVERIKDLYNQVHYHAFEHAAHVTMSVNRLLQMCLDPQDKSTNIDEDMFEDGSRSDANPTSTTPKRRSVSRRTTLQHVHFPLESLASGEEEQPLKNPDLISRTRSLRLSIVSASSDEMSVLTSSDCNSAAANFNRTYGLSADPFSHFALVFAALVHDVEHQGVPNSTLIEEGDELAFRYNNKSIAEQNSLAVAFGILRLPEFKNLSRAIMPTPEDSLRLREKVIDIILATDISSRERAQILKNNWCEAFEAPFVSALLPEDDDNESSTPAPFDKSLPRRHSFCASKASVVVRADLQNILAAQAFHLHGQPTTRPKAGHMLLKQNAVLETMMIAADVAHTMQDFGTFVKWNANLYHELKAAYVSGRNSFDPSAGWYENQIGFFNGYIIPLAEKLRQCDVFGDQSSLFVDCAKKNLKQWIEEGESITEAIIESIAL